MNILVDIVHPADVLFFLNPVKEWRTLGHRVCIVSRSKDVSEDLLDAFELEHRSISKAGTNLVDLGLELIRRDFKLLGIARIFQPDVMVGFGGIAISHVGKLMGVPSISFYDTERAPLQHRFTLPFISHLYVSDCYDGPIAKGRTTRLPWFKEFSYLHPDNFQADRKLALAAGLAANSKNFFIRLVAWQANHDVGHTGWSESTLSALVTFLGQSGKVHISSELPLPAELGKYRYSGPIHEVHHLLAYCDCYIGESATMASEAALLGVPSLYASSDRRGYTDELAAGQLLWKLPEVNFDALKLAIENIDSVDAREWQQRVDHYRQQKINVSDLVVEATLRHGAEGS